MHEISLGHTITDYLTGEELDATTYDDVRQALARVLVEEKGYPMGNLKPRVDVTFPIEGKSYCRIADLVAYDDAGAPLFMLLFTPGNVLTYQRETLSAARLLPDGAAPLAAATDSREAVLLRVSDGEQLAEGMNAIPYWERLLELAAAHPAPEISEQRADKERRILYAYSEFVYGCCSYSSCAMDAKGARFQDG